jgi:hypothetical protein
MSSLNHYEGEMIWKLLEMASRRIFFKDVMLLRWRNQVVDLGTCVVEAYISLYSSP